MIFPCTDSTTVSGVTLSSMFSLSSVLPGSLPLLFLCFCLLSPVLLCFDSFFLSLFAFHFFLFSPTGEYHLLHEKFGFTPAELVKMIDNGFSATFLNTSHQYTMRNEAIQDCVAVLKEVCGRREERRGEEGRQESEETNARGRM